MSASGATEPDLSLVVVQLMKGVLYRETHDKQWRHLLALQAQVRDYMRVIGLTVIIDESEGYAYLRSRPEDDDAPAVPRLIPRRALSFHVSLLLALLRKKLAEHDAKDGAARVILTREQIVEMVRLFQPESSNEARLVEQQSPVPRILSRKGSGGSWSMVSPLWRAFGQRLPVLLSEPCLVSPYRSWTNCDPPIRSKGTVPVRRARCWHRRDLPVAPKPLLWKDFQVVRRRTSVP